MRIPIVNTDSIGIIQDVSPHDLPLQAWSDGRNVRMIDGRVEKITGHKASFTPLFAPKFLLPFQHTTGYWWLYAGNDSVAAYQNGASVNVNRAIGGLYNATESDWTGGFLNGVPVLSLPTTVPQQWNPGMANKLVPLANWPSNWLTSNLKPFGFYLVALQVAKDGVAQPYNVNWSHPAEPGTVPISWDIADPTRDAGEYTLADTPGFIMNQLGMRDVNLIYKEDSIYSMQYVGGQSIFDFTRLFKENVGLLMPNGLCNFTPPGKGDYHMVFSANDLIIHDGRSITSVFEGRMRKWLYNNLDSDNFKKSFILNNIAMKELWVCFPLVGSAVPNCALIWNYSNNTMTVRDLPPVSCAAVGQITEIVSGQTSASWSADTGTWDADTSSWGSSAYQPVASRLLMGSATTSKTYVMDIGSQFEDANYNSFVERTGLTIVGSANGQPIQDSEVVKLLSEIWLRVQGNVGTVIDVYVGVQDDRGKYPEWQGPYPFVIGVDKKINPLISGRIISLRFECAEASIWQLHGYDLNVLPVGAY